MLLTELSADPSPVNQQVQEMDMIRREVYQLEQSYNQVKMKYVNRVI